MRLSFPHPLLINNYWYEVGMLKVPELLLIVPLGTTVSLKKNLNASRPSEHPTQTGGKLSKRLVRWGDHNRLQSCLMTLIFKEKSERI